MNVSESKIKVGINIYKGSGEFATYMYMVHCVLKWMHNYIGLHLFDFSPPCVFICVLKLLTVKSLRVTLIYLIGLFHWNCF